MKKVLFVNNYGMDKVNFSEALGASLEKFGLKRPVIICVETVEEGLDFLACKRREIGLVMSNTIGGYDEPERLVREIKERRFDVPVMIVSPAGNGWNSRNPQYCFDPSVRCVGKGFCRIVFDVFKNGGPR